ncbi:MAG: hypothetical protein IPO64_07065 [Bacteroidetes bacterium]|nr:hypothetical protein [Bacteroidota bacterium]
MITHSMGVTLTRKAIKTRRCL